MWSSALTSPIGSQACGSVKSTETTLLAKGHSLLYTGIDHGLNEQIDHELIALAKEAIEQRKPVKIEMPMKIPSSGWQCRWKIALAHGAEVT